MGISAACANLKTSLMHAYKAGVIHLLMWPQRPQRRRCSGGVAQRTGMMSCRQTACFPSAEVTRFWRAIKKQKNNGNISLHPLLEKKKFIMRPKVYSRNCIKSFTALEENKLNFSVRLFQRCTFFKFVYHFFKKKKKREERKSSMSAALTITNINKPFMYC